MRPSITIIIPCFNAEPFLAETLQSALAQSHRDIELEVLVVDDGSTDGSADIARQFSGVRLLQTANGGVSSARNLGLQAAEGDWIKFLDADDLLWEGALLRQWQQAQVAGDSTLPVGAYLLRDATRRDRLKPPPQLSGKDPVTAVILANIHPNTPLHRRSLLEKIGGFDTRFATDEDWNLHVRLAAAGACFAPDRSLVSVYRIHDAAHRLSNAKPRAPDYIGGQLQRLQWTRSAIATTPMRDAAFARRALWLARVAARRGEHDSARHCFNVARALSPEHHARFLPFRYRALLRLLGSEGGEAALLSYWSRSR